MIPLYTAVCVVDLETLSSTVGILIGQGYVPIGGISVRDEHAPQGCITLYYQAMVYKTVLEGIKT